MVVPSFPGHKAFHGSLHQLGASIPAHEAHARRSFVVEQICDGRAVEGLVLKVAVYRGGTRFAEDKRLVEGPFPVWERFLQRL